MKRAIFPMTEEERAAQQDQFRAMLDDARQREAILNRLVCHRPDMAQIDEPEPDTAPPFVILYTLLGACATVAFGLGAFVMWWL